jgi:hypothetical protein
MESLDVDIAHFFSVYTLINCRCIKPNIIIGKTLYKWKTIGALNPQLWIVSIKIIKTKDKGQ